MASRILALLIWAAVAASLAYWGLRWLARPTGVPANATPVSLNNAAHGDFRRLLAGPAKAVDTQTPDATASAALAARIKLLGLVAPRAAGDGQGVALLTIDGKPPRAVRLGGLVDGELVLQTLSQTSAEIGPRNGPVALKLDLPLMPPPSVGSLPPVAGLSQEPAPGQVGTVQAPNDGAVEGAPTYSAPSATGRLAAPEGASGGMPPHRPLPRTQRPLRHPSSSPA